MKSLTLTLAFASLAAVTAPLGAQGSGRNIDGVPPGHRPAAGMCRVWVDGVAPGRQAAPTDCNTARAQAAANGGRVIYGSDRGRRDCTYSQTRNSIGDVIFGRTGDANCESRDRVDNVWYEVGRDRNNNLIYERRRLDANGRLVVERARRDALGNFTIIGSRNANSSDDKTWRKAQKQQAKAVRKAEKAEAKAIKRADKAEAKAIKRANKADRDDRWDDDDDDDDDDRNRGRSNGKNKDKGKGKGKN